MTDQEQEPWPEKMYLLHPSIKTFGAMVSNSERREYVRADRIEELEARNKELTLQLLATSGQAADALDKLTKAVALALLECPYEYDTKSYEDWWDDRRAVLAALESKI